MADFMATIANIGILKVIGAVLIVGLLVAAFAVGGSKGDKGGKGKGNSGGTNSNNQTTDGGSK